MSYPLDAATALLNYSDGNRSNKFYRLMLVVNPTGQSFVLRHYGKVNTAGDVIVKSFNSQAAAEKEYEKLHKEKTGKGYTLTSGDTRVLNNEADFRAFAGITLWPRIPSGAMLHVLPDADVSGRKEANPPRFDENGKFLDPKARTFSPQEIADAKRREEAERRAQLELEAAEAEKVYKSNRRFGMF